MRRGLGIGDRGPGTGRRVAVVVALAAAFGCTSETGELPAGPVGFGVTITGGDVGAPDARLPFSLDGVTYTLDIKAEPSGSFADGWVALHSEPGDIVAVTGPGEVIRSNVRLSGGQALGVQVTIREAYGDTRLWVEDLGFVPGPAIGSACDNGIDDDGDGRTDYPEDPGCAFSNDDSETGGSHAVGLAEKAGDNILYFANPRIADVQGLSSVPTLLGRSVAIDGGDMIVTRVSVSGLYVTDIAETRGYASIYAYNFNTPRAVRVCDHLTSLSGIVGEFYGYTELGYPSWVRDPDWPRPVLPQSAAECPVPDPVELISAVLDSTVTMEQNEAGLAQVTGGTIAANFQDCDANHNGSIEFGTAEDTCATACAAALNCTELTNFLQYGQFAIATAGATAAAQRKMLVVTRDTIPDFDPREHAGETIPLLRGTLHQVSFLTPPWILEVRCRDDLVLDGETAKPMYQACVSPPDNGDDYSP